MSHDSNSIRVRSSVEISAAIRARRRGANLTQVHASGLAGVGTRFLAELESGKPTAQLGKALQILDLLGIDVWLVPRGGGDFG